MKRSSRVFLIDEDGENKLAQSLERLKYQLRKDSIEEECEDDVNGETNESKWSHIRHNWLKQSISQQSSITPTNTALIVNKI
ncbi:hypothetical protein QR98_0071970 [Sarcoptes scabiei]|uniref:Uncharacterized protein n=1 Tax=Sarcoptes scabiei TaxID=52283 RepID=A0A132ACF7_SARSC|nr:hypothetical protein QR98_0071970 [Sarcoptes scabiei]